MDSIKDIKYMHPSWIPVLAPIEKEILKTLHKVEKLGHKKEILPDYNSIFRAFAVPFDKVRVVIIGQDPYPRKEYATGLAFSVKNNVKTLPMSLKNIIKEMENNISEQGAKVGGKSLERVSLDAAYSDDILKSWVEQGVFLLNTILTVEAKKPLSHKDLGWQPITTFVLKALTDRKNTNLAVVLWGNNARALKKVILEPDTKDSRNICVVEGVHPSPLSANRGFFGSKPFSKINEFFRANNEPEIIWRV